MGLNRKKPTGVPESEERDALDWGNLEEDDHDGRLVYVADLGLQTKEFKGEFKGNFQQIALGIEAVGKSITTEEGEVLPRVLWTRPFNIYDKMDEKSKEFEFYSLFDSSATEDTIPDWEAQLGKPISFTVVHVEGKGENKGKKYDNIASLARIPKKYQGDVGEAVATLGVGDSDDPENPVTKGLFGLPKYVFDKRIIEDATKVDETVTETDEDPFS